MAETSRTIDGSILNTTSSCRAGARPLRISSGGAAHLIDGDAASILGNPQRLGYFDRNRCLATDISSDPGARLSCQRTQSFWDFCDLGNALRPFALIVLY